MALITIWQFLAQRPADLVIQIEKSAGFTVIICDRGVKITDPIDSIESIEDSQAPDLTKERGNR
jgi:hypothetical protein